MENKNLGIRLLSIFMCIILGIMSCDDHYVVEPDDRLDLPKDTISEQEGDSESELAEPVTVIAQTTMTSGGVAYKAETIECLPGYKQKDISLNKYGSRMDKCYNATGFFHTEFVDGRWYIIDPEGYPYIHRGVAVVKPGTQSVHIEAFNKKYGSNDVWARQTAMQLRSLGFTGFGAWSKHDMFLDASVDIVYTVALAPMDAVRVWHENLVGGYDPSTTGWKGYEYELVRIFDSEAPRIFRESCSYITKYKNDPYLLGYYVDNELPWVRDALDRHLINLDPDDDCRIEAQRWLDARKGKPSTVNDITEDDRHAFWVYYAESYYKLVSEVVKEYDPNHMILGSRFCSYKLELADADFLGAAGKYMDVISINGYRKWELPQYMMDNWTNWSGRPFIISEFYTKGKDLGYPNEDGVGFVVATQRERGYYYENYCLNLLRNKGCVGWDWFQFHDNKPEGVDSNKGLFSPSYDPYTDLTNVCMKFNTQVYSLIDYLNIGGTQYPLKIFPSKDTFVRSDSSDDYCYGLYDTLTMKNSGSEKNVRFALLEFDLSPLQSYTDKIESASLRLYLFNGTSESESVSVAAYQTQYSEWTEYDMNNDIFTNYKQDNDILLGEVLMDLSSVNQSISIIVTQGLVSCFNSGQNNLKIRVSSNTLSSAMFDFASREASTELMLPCIEIKYKSNI